MYERRRDTDAQLRRFVDVLARQRAQLETAPRRPAHDARRGARAGSGGAARAALAEQGMSGAPAFPAALTDTRAFAIAHAMLDGFDRHYRLFRQASAEAKARFEAADWHGQQRAQAQRIEYYDRRVAEATERLQSEFQAATLADGGLAAGQAALHRPAHRPLPARVRRDLLQLGDDQDPAPQLLPQRLHLRPLGGLDRAPRERRAGGAADLPRLLPDARRRCARPGTASSPTSSSSASSRTSTATSIDVMAAVAAQLGEFRMRTNFQIQVLSSLFFRNKGAYIVGKIINGFNETPFALPILHGATRRLVDRHRALRRGRPAAASSASRAPTSWSTMEVPSAYVQFLRSLMPSKPHSELYSALGLQKQGKSLFYRDLLMHLRHSTDKFRIAPGIKGMVMLVFDLPSFPYVFKVIKDFYPPPKDDDARADQAQVPAGQAARPRRPHGRHARVQRRRASRARASTTSWSPSCSQLLRRACSRRTATTLVIRHVYIERRMIPLNIYLQDATRRADRARRSSSTATRSRTWCAPTSSPATCCGRTSASRATARSSSTTTTRSNT